MTSAFRAKTLSNAEPSVKDILCYAPHYSINPDISTFATQIAVEAMIGFGDSPIGEFRLPDLGKLPARLCTFHLPGVISAGGADVLVVAGEIDHSDYPLKSTGVDIAYIQDDGALIRAGSFCPGHCGFRGPCDGPLEPICLFLIKVAYILSVINQPAFTVKTDTTTRQQRRAAQRGGFLAVPANYQVSWNIGADVKAKMARDPDFHCVPLHWRRGHYRLAEAHWVGAHIPSGILDPRRQGLPHQWIEGQWVGHPAFGLKLATHAPRLSDDTVSRKWNLPHTLEQAERF